MATTCSSGEVIEGEKTKPKRVSWPKEMPLEQADLACALKLLSLPRELGAHPESGKKVIVNIGRFGPYIGHDGKFKSIPRTDSIFDISLDRAVELLAQAREGNTVLRVLGDHPDDKDQRGDLQRPLRPLRPPRQDQRHSAQGRFTGRDHAGRSAGIDRGQGGEGSNQQKTCGQDH